MARSTSMQVLTNQLKAKYPGIVVYGIGDAAHQGSPSGHNEDDTPGSRPEEEDADNKPEHRALDPMVSNAFPDSEAEKVVQALISRPANRERLRYVIYKRRIWRRANGWVQEPYTGSDPHTSHPHLSGRAVDDENTAAWDIGGTPVSDLPIPGGITVADASYNDLIFNVNAMLANSPVSGGPSKVPNNLRLALQSIQNTINELAGRPVNTVTLTPAQVAEIRDAVVDAVTDAVAEDESNDLTAESLAAVKEQVKAALREGAE